MPEITRSFVCLKGATIPVAKKGGRVKRLTQLKRRLNALTAGKRFDHPEAEVARDLGTRIDTLLELLEAEKIRSVICDLLEPIGKERPSLDQTGHNVLI